MNLLSPSDSAPLYVEMMGGAAKILARGWELHDEGKYLLVQEILNKLVHAEPDNKQAKNLLADVFEQIGYQQENPGLRNSFLAGAYELRTGIPQGAPTSRTPARSTPAVSPFSPSITRSAPSVPSVTARPERASTPSVTRPGPSAPSIIEYVKQGTEEVY